MKRKKSYRALGEITSAGVVQSATMWSDSGKNEGGHWLMEPTRGTASLMLGPKGSFVLSFNAEELHRYKSHADLMAHFDGNQFHTSDPGRFWGHTPSIAFDDMGEVMMWMDQLLENGHISGWRDAFNPVKTTGKDLSLRTELPHVFVSTNFLPGEGFYETMVFRKEHGGMGHDAVDFARYSSKAEAERGHKAMSLRWQSRGVALHGLSQAHTPKCARNEVPVCMPRHQVPGLMGVEEQLYRWEVHSKRDGWEGTFHSEEDALNYVRLLVESFGEPFKSFTVKKVKAPPGAVGSLGAVEQKTVPQFIATEKDVYIRVRAKYRHGSFVLTPIGRDAIQVSAKTDWDVGSCIAAGEDLRVMLQQLLSSSAESVMYGADAGEAVGMYWGFRLSKAAKQALSVYLDALREQGILTS